HRREFIRNEFLLKFSSQLFCKILEEKPVQNGVNKSQMSLPTILNALFKVISFTSLARSA
ncbi:unnamed protein product, partial [Allacma fusca]